MTEIKPLPHHAAAVVEHLVAEREPNSKFEVTTLHGKVIFGECVDDGGCSLWEAKKPRDYDPYFSFTRIDGFWHPVHYAGPAGFRQGLKRLQTRWEAASDYALVRDFCSHWLVRVGFDIGFYKRTETHEHV